MAVEVVTIGIMSEAVDVAAVRSLAGQVGPLLGLDVDGRYVELLTSELTSNAVRADAGEVTATFRRAGEALRVEIHDNGGGRPVLTQPQPLDENGGRGLLIVDAIADAWGADAHPDDGTTVWFELGRGVDADGARRPRYDAVASATSSRSDRSGSSPDAPSAGRPH